MVELPPAHVGETRYVLVKDGSPRLTTRNRLADTLLAEHQARQLSLVLQYHRKRLDRCVGQRARRPIERSIADCVAQHRALDLHRLSRNLRELPSQRTI